jgi:hypothetical protein
MTEPIRHSASSRNRRKALHHIRNIKVSIHAPVKEATSFRSELCVSQCVSIHAPVKEATPW